MKDVVLNADVCRHIGVLFIRLHNLLFNMNKLDRYEVKIIDDARERERQMFNKFLYGYKRRDNTGYHYDNDTLKLIEDNLLEMKVSFEAYDDEHTDNVCLIVDGIILSFKTNTIHRGMED